MKLPLHDLKNQKKSEVELPLQFEEEYRPDLIKRSVLSLQSKSRQKYGASPEAGMRHSAELSRRRRKYRGSYGLGISRVTRKILSRRGTRMYWVGALAPSTVGGRRAHPPKAEKNWEQKINKKENRKAIRSAMAATLNKDLVQQRGHHLPESYPFIIDNSLEQISKTKEIKETLESLGFTKELERSAIKKIRAGMGKLRGRKYQKKKGPLIVVGEDCPLTKAAKNIPGIEIVRADQINTHLLAPGTAPGRVTIWTDNAIKQITEKKLFI
ncbi:50S ribosomal protein L4 [Candidatus Woesearchaeota archaeon]|nr:50S ribosomal protein L4 [Candidatus Woesearchaeota archaeon]